MDYTITATLAHPFERMREAQTDAIIEALIEYHPAIGTGSTGGADVTISLPADSLAQATKTATALLTHLHPVGLEVMPTELWDRREGLAPLPELLSVSQAAERLGVTRQAVLQRIEAGKLPAQRIGSVWAVPATAAA